MSIVILMREQMLLDAVARELGVKAEDIRAVFWEGESVDPARSVVLGGGKERFTSWSGRLPASLAGRFTRFGFAHACVRSNLVSQWIASAEVVVAADSFSRMAAWVLGRGRAAHLPVLAGLTSARRYLLRHP